MRRFDQVRANIRRAYEAGRATVRASREGGNGDPDLDAAIDGYGEGLAATDAEPVLPGPDGQRPDLFGHPSTVSRDDTYVPRGLRIAAGWSWRMLVIGVLGYFLIDLLSRLKIVMVPLAIALLLSALLSPAVRYLRRLGFPRSLATAVVLIGGLAAMAGTLTAVINQFVNNLPDLAENTGAALRQIQRWLKNGPLHLSDNQLDDFISRGQDWLGQSKNLTSGALSATATVFEVFAGFVLVLFATFFLLRDGRTIWRFLVRLCPAVARERVNLAGEASWGTLTAYVRATVLVAFIDAVGIGLWLVILRVPFAFPLAALVFLSAFIPIVGATLSGAVAVLIALVDANGGPFKALLVLIGVIVVQQLEGHVLQPFIMGRAVAIHPLAVIMAISCGAVLSGIIGALVAVPIVAVLNTGVRRLIQPHREPAPQALVVQAPT